MKHSIVSRVQKTRKIIARFFGFPSVQQLIHSHRLFSPSEQKILVGCFVIIATSCIWLGANYLRTNIILIPAKGGTYTEGIIGQPRFVNPVFANSSPVDTDLTKLLFSGLFTYNKNLELIPDLAASYTQSEDGKVYDIALREDVTWHDGEAVTATDVVFTFDSITDPLLSSPLAQTFQGIVIEEIDEHKVRFTLREPYNSFLNTLTTGIIPEHIWGSIPLNQWRQADFNIRPIGSGDWQFSTLNKEESGFVKGYTITRRPAAEQNSFIDTIIFKMYGDEISARAALQSRAIQGLAFLSATEKDEEATRGTGLERYELELPAVTGIFFNQNQPGALQDNAVRQALREAIDRRALVAAFAGTVKINDSPLPLRVLPQTEPKEGKKSTPPKQLLTNAGWKLQNGIRTKNNEPLTITLTAIDREPDRTISTQIQNDWQTLGVDAKINLVSPATPEHIRRSVLRPRAYEALLYTIVYGANPDPYAFWHSSQRIDPGLNFALFSDKKADNAIELIRRTLDEEKRSEAYQTLHTVIQEQTPAIFLFAPIRQYLIANTVQGIQIPMLAEPADRFRLFDSWFVKTKRKINR